MGNGLNNENCTLLFGGAAGDFSAMSFDERLSLAKESAKIVNGRTPIALGGQTTNTQELEKLANVAKDFGYDFLQVSCPFYFKHTKMILLNIESSIQCSGRWTRYNFI